MIVAFNNLHILTIRHGEVYVHHFWFLAALAYLVAGAASRHIPRNRK